jgi:hypothetical protein
MRVLCAAMAVLALLCLGGIAQADPTFESGTLTTVAHSKVDAAAVVSWKATADDIEAGSTAYNKTNFAPTEASIWKSGGVLSQGGMAAFMTTIAGLQANDIIVVHENQQWRADSGGTYESFYAYDSYIKVTSYTHNPTNTILNWLNYISDNGDGTFTFVKGSAVYEISDDGTQPDPASIVGIQYKIDRTLEVYRGATLLNPVTSSRGYTTGSGVSGAGWLVQNISSAEFTIVPEPSSIIALVGGLGSLLAFRRRRA